MPRKKVYEVYYAPNLPTPNKPVVFNPEVCKGCNICVDACMNEVLLPNLEKGKPPIVAYPDECWYCGCCLMECPKGDDALQVKYPLINSPRWKDKVTGEHFRLGMPNPPPPNLRPPVPW